MTTEEFINTYCAVCGSQRCLGPNTDFSEGCPHYMDELKTKYAQDKYNALGKMIKEQEKMYDES